MACRTSQTIDGVIFFFFWRIVSAWRVPLSPAVITCLGADGKAKAAGPAIGWRREQLNSSTEHLGVLGQPRLMRTFQTMARGSKGGHDGFYVSRSVQPEYCYTCTGRPANPSDLCALPVFYVYHLISVSRSHLVRRRVFAKEGGRVVPCACSQKQPRFPACPRNGKCGGPDWTSGFPRHIGKELRCLSGKCHVALDIRLCSVSKGSLSF